MSYKYSVFLLFSGKMSMYVLFTLLKNNRFLAYLKIIQIDVIIRYLKSQDLILHCHLKFLYGFDEC